ncbi:MAG: tRNA lysidine(34) synthetase TilS [Gammaproteobacteria bacterium]
MSGGADSAALLLAMHALREQGSSMVGAKLAVEAVHVNHGLQDDALLWQSRCEQLCARLGVLLHTREVDARALAGEGPEAAARAARYDAFASLMRPGDILWCAHHRDDQVETLLLALLRGSGPRGLAGMAQWKAFATGWLFRPLLPLSRAELRGAVAEAGFEPVVDPSNADSRYKRSALRQTVLPALEACSPGAAATLARAARHQAEAAALLDALGRADCGYATSGSGAGGPGSRCPSTPSSLPLDRLDKLGVVRARNALRVWIGDLDLPVPGARVFDTAMVQLLDAKPDAMPVVRWRGAELRRYRGEVWASRPLGHHDPKRLFDWPSAAQGASLDVGSGIVSLQAGDPPGSGQSRLLDRERVASSRVQLGFRRGGESCRPSGAAHRRSLKHLLRERAVAPWLRDRLPLVYLDGELAAVGDLLVCHGFEAVAGGSGLAVRWRPENTSDACRR